MHNPPFRFAAMAAGITALLASSPVCAATMDGVVLPDSGDTAWLLSAALIALATAVPGLLLYLIGCAGRSMLERTLTAAVAGGAVAALIYLALGYSLMFDTTPGMPIGDYLGGAANWMLNLMGTVREGTTVPETGFVLFQFVFVLLAVALIAGALAPRARPGWLLAFTGLWTLVVLAPVTRWIWGGGWLAGIGAVDFAGGLPVFYCAGVSAIVALAMVGAPRDAELPSPYHRLRLTGALLLLAGMMALAGGATLGAGDGAAVAALTLLASAATGAISLCAIRRSVDAATLAGGLVAGTVAAAAAGDGISIGGAVLIGGLSAGAFAVTPRFVRRLWQDRGASVASIAGAAKTGSFLFGFFLAFSPFGGSGYADGMTMGGQVLAQTIAILAIGGWSIIGTVIAGLAVGVVLPMRGDARDGGRGDLET